MANIDSNLYTPSNYDRIQNFVSRSRNDNVCYPFGTNIFNNVYELGIFNGNTGLPMANNSYIRSKDFIPVNELSNYVFSCDTSLFDKVLVYEYKEDYSYNLTTNKVVPLGSSFTTNSGTRFIRFRFNTQFTDTSIKLQLQSGSIATSYVPYSGCIYGINLYDSINDYFLTDNYYLNCGIIALFLALIIIVINAPFIIFRKIRG